MNPSSLANRIDQAVGNRKADWVIKNANLFNLVDGSLTLSDIAGCGDTVVGVYGEYSGEVEFDAQGLFAVPGFIDSHLHVESSLVSPGEFERCVLPCGTTTAICDPHEIANVLGKEGLRYFLDCAEAMRMDLRVQLSSCVPATEMETAGAELTADDLLPFLAHPKVVGLAEFMNFPGVIGKAPQVMDKLEKFAGEHVDGHCPLLRGKELNGYLSAGISTDHESTELEEAKEKLLKGTRVLIREGSVTKDVEKLVPLLTDTVSPFVCFCTDDRNFKEIAEHGHLDFIVAKAVRLGVSPLAAYRAASWSAARTFGLKGKGLIAPGYRADILLLSDLEACAVRKVFCGGRLVDGDFFAGRDLPLAVGLDSVRIDPVEARNFEVRGSGESTPVIDVIPGKIITGFSRLDLPALEGRIQTDPSRDVAKICVLERHGKNGNVGLGFCRGFGFGRGALASSVGHDAHNVCTVGFSDGDMALAVNRLREIKGGYVAVRDGEILADFPLPLAGLMSVEPWEACEPRLAALQEAVKKMGCLPEEPFQHLAFMSLSVIPHLKITDMGWVDVDRFRFVEA